MVPYEFQICIHLISAFKISKFGSRKHVDNLITDNMLIRKKLKIVFKS